MTRTCHHCHKPFDDSAADADAWDQYCSFECQAKGWRAVNFMEIIMDWFRKK